MKCKRVHQVVLYSISRSECPGGVGRGNSHIVNDGGACRKFSNNTLKCSRISFDRRGPNIFFRLITLKVTAIILTVVILGFSTLSSTNLQILTPKRYPRYFYMGLPFPFPSPPPRGYFVFQHPKQYQSTHFYP